MPLTSSLRGIAAMMLSTGFFVSTDVCMKIAMGSAPPIQVNFMRGLAGTVLGLSLLLALGYGPQFKYFLNKWVLLRGLCEMVAGISFIIAFARMPLGDITALYQTAPFIIILASAFFWRDRLKPINLVLVAIGFTGALLVAQPGSSTASPYALLGFVVAIFAAARDVVNRRVPPEAPALLTGIATIMLVMLASGLASALFETMVLPSLPHAGLMVLAGFLVIFGQLFVVLAFRLAAPQAVAPFYYTFLLWAVIYGYAIFGEIPNTLAVYGMILIVASGIAVVLLENRRTDKRPSLGPIEDARAG